jgi:hypothetical protein
MFRSLIALMGMLVWGYSALARGVPLELAEMEAQARVAAIKTFIQVSGVSGSHLFYEIQETMVGKYEEGGLGWGTFGYIGEVWTSSDIKYRCRLEPLMFRRVESSGQYVAVNPTDLIAGTRCQVVPANFIGLEALARAAAIKRFEELVGPADTPVEHI